MQFVNCGVGGRVAEPYGRCGEFPVTLEGFSAVQHSSGRAVSEHSLANDAAPGPPSSDSADSGSPDSTAVMYALLALLALAQPLQAGIAQHETRGFFQNMFNRRPTLSDEKNTTCNCLCGERNDASRIIGGEPATVNEFPWIVRLSYFNRFYCGGMLINDRHVLTAAHCVKGFMWFMIKVTLGEHDRCETGAKPETRFVLRATPADFSYLNFDNDIAILRLNDRVPITQTIRPICLPSTSAQVKYDGKMAIASGWGTLKENGKPACILQEVELPIMSNEECRQTNYSASMISDNMLCAGYTEGLKDSCQGDSGGPLIRERDDKRYELIGVVSWGNGCARPGYPGIYTRVSRYVDWIRNNTLGGCWCEDPPSAPGKATEAPTKVTEAPAKATEAPAKATEAPGEATEAPAKATEAPAEANEAPAKATEAPAKATEAPAEATEAPAKATGAPAEATKAPAKGTEDSNSLIETAKNLGNVFIEEITVDRI